MIVYRSSFGTLWLTLSSNEALGVLDTDYLEDYFGADGQVTVHHVEGLTDYPVAMVGQADQTPETPNDVFMGQLALATIPNGNYEIRARCRDITGNYSILNSVDSPIGGEQIITPRFEVKDGAGLHYPAGGPELGRVAITPTGLSRPPLDSRLALSRPTLAVHLTSTLRY